MTPELLQAATGCTRERAALFAPLLAEACAAYPINTPKRLAAFLAQVGHESGSFQWLRELWGPTAQQLRYEGRADLGNTIPGDGRKYAGHGWIQVTGRFNHRKAFERLSKRFGPGVPDFEAQPERLSDPRWAVMSAADFWCERDCNRFADADDFEGLTRRINGGLTGLSDRLVRWKLAKLALGESAPKYLPTPTTTLERIMPIPAVALALLPSLIESIPLLGKLFGSGSEVSERNTKAATIALEVVQKAVGAVNLQDAVEKVQANPAMAAAATSAVEASWLQLTEAGGGGIAGARVSNAEYMKPGAAGFWVNPAFWISVLLMLMPFMLLVDVFYVHPTSYTGELRTQIVTAVLIVIGVVSGYWIGSSLGSAKKDERGTL